MDGVTETPKHSPHYSYDLYSTNLKTGEKKFKYLNKQTGEWADKVPEGATHDISEFAYRDQKEKIENAHYAIDGILKAEKDKQLDKFYTEQFQKEAGIHGIEPQYFTEDGQYIPPDRRYGDIKNPYLGNDGENK